MTTPIIILLIILTAIAAAAAATAIAFIYYERTNYWHLQWLKESLKHPYPIAYHTVDIALFRLERVGAHITAYVVMGQKPKEVGTGLWRFPGGFVDPTDLSAEAAVLRECREEVNGPEIDLYPKYITSMLTNDERYRESRDKILTSFYKVQYIYGPIKAGDDLAEVCWMPIDESSLEKINPIHKKLFEALINDFKTI